MGRDRNRFHFWQRKVIANEMFSLNCEIAIPVLQPRNGFLINQISEPRRKISNPVTFTRFYQISDLIIRRYLDIYSGSSLLNCEGRFADAKMAKVKINPFFHAFLLAANSPPLPPHQTPQCNFSDLSNIVHPHHKELRGQTPEDL